MDIEKLFYNSYFLSFHNLMSELSGIMNYSYIGFNYSEEKVISVKFYYVFFENIDFQGRFPIPELENIYKKMINDSSVYHLTTPFTPGGGCTFTIKFDFDETITKAFFFRVKNNNSEIVHNIQKLYPIFSFNTSDFEDGYGQYVLWKNGDCIKNEYLYLTNSGRIHAIETKYGIHFSKTPCTEISSAGDVASSQKFIALGGDNLMSEAFLDKIPCSIRNIVKGLNVELCCPAVNPSKEEFTIYAYSKGVQKNDGYSPIDEMMKKYR